MFAVGHEIRKYIVGAKDFDYSDIVAAGRRIQSIALDPHRRLIYWSDSSLKTILRAMIPTDTKQLAHSQDLEISDIVAPNGVAFDWVAKLVADS